MFYVVKNAEYVQLMSSYDWAQDERLQCAISKGCTFRLTGWPSWKGLLAHTTGGLPASALSAPCPSPLKRLKK